MNLSTLIGFIASFGVLWLALISSAHRMEVFLDRHAILIVCGGTMAASCVCFSLPRMANLFKIFVRRMLGKQKKNYLRIIEDLVALSRAARKGRQMIEPAIASLSDPFLRDAAGILFFLESEVTMDDLRSLLETRAETHFERYLGEAEIFRTMSKFPPAFGLMGTTLGMISLLQGLGSPSARNVIGPSMSIALVATFYGIFLSNFIFVPIAENLTQQSKEDLVARRIVVEGIVLIASEKPTQFIQEKLLAFLLPSERGRFDLTPAKPRLSEVA